MQGSREKTRAKEVGSLQNCVVSIFFKVLYELNIYPLDDS